MIEATARSATRPSSTMAWGPAPTRSEATPEPQNPLRALGDPDLAVETQPLGARPGVGDQERAEDGHHAGDDGRNPVRDIGRRQQERADADEGGPVAYPVERRVVEGPEPGDHRPAASHLAVQGIRDPAQQQKSPAETDVSHAVGKRGDEDQTGARPS